MPSHYCLVKMLRGHFNESKERASLKTPDNLRRQNTLMEHHRMLFLFRANSVRTTALYGHPLDTDMASYLCPGERKPLQFL